MYLRNSDDAGIMRTSIEIDDRLMREGDAMQRSSD